MIIPVTKNFSIPFFVLSSLLVTQIANSQSNIYYPFPLAENSTWQSDVFVPYNCPYLWNYLCTSIQDRTAGDTVIFGLKYFTIKEDYYDYADSTTTGEITIGYLREDTLNKKIYWVCYQCPAEQLILDFDLNAGDTSFASLNWTLVVDSVDSMLVGNAYYRRINFHNSYPVHIYIVEGMGSGAGLLAGYSDHYGFEGKQVLKCFKENNILLYEDTTYNYSNCELFTSVTNHQPQFFTSINPNPVLLNSNLSIESGTDRQSQFEFYDLTGRFIDKINFSRKTQYFIDDRKFFPGVFIILEKKEGLITRKNILVIQ